MSNNSNINPLHLLSMPSSNKGDNKSELVLNSMSFKNIYAKDNQSPYQRYQDFDLDIANQNSFFTNHEEINYKSNYTPAIDNSTVPFFNNEENLPFENRENNITSNNNAISENNESNFISSSVKGNTDLNTTLENKEKQVSPIDHQIAKSERLTIGSTFNNSNIILNNLNSKMSQNFVIEKDSLLLSSNKKMKSKKSLILMDGDLQLYSSSGNNLNSERSEMESSPPNQSPQSKSSSSKFNNYDSGYKGISINPTDSLILEGKLNLSDINNKLYKNSVDCMTFGGNSFNDKKSQSNGRGNHFNYSIGRIGYHDLTMQISNSFQICGDLASKHSSKTNLPSPKIEKSEIRSAFSQYREVIYKDIENLKNTGVSNISITDVTDFKEFIFEFAGHYKRFLDKDFG
eukprot:CAMPEP_0170521554 /NCGR_PEP_ID=MMETSP0209-20121228/6925_1 /TAXON_ID=665100 ORGANISM="Litonotus pictus, Strain P1" /NCGR_SAMPLE_ID=MMETSP0209 /ASSEMBLY_ACC=CAM_ASM_000301 /LENGTH=401 /DNA_ID=CAMNT_0010808499 /DNA_START=2519 /DNA_END=3720 /DNA_ORIENTATION=-